MQDSMKESEKVVERKLVELCKLNGGMCIKLLSFHINGLPDRMCLFKPAKVIFVDSQKDNCEMDYDKVAEAITEKTKAVVAVDLGGIICDYDKLYQAIESKKNLFTPRNDNTLGARIQQTLNRVMVFADCAHALGAVRKGKMAGEWADFSSFSFHAVKNFTTAEGGASTHVDE